MSLILITTGAARGPRSSFAVRADVPPQIDDNLYLALHAEQHQN